MFAEKSYDDVLVEDIAANAGVSRALIYHYFSSKRDIDVALFKHASGRLLARASPNPELPLAEQVTTALEAHIKSSVDNPFDAATINRSALSDDPAIQAIVAEQLDVVGQQLVEKLAAEGRPPGVSEIAVEGWLAFVRAACLKWIDSQTISHEDLTEMCLQAFDCALGSPTPTSRTRARISGVMQYPGDQFTDAQINVRNLNSVPDAAVGHDSTRLGSASGGSR